MNTYIARTDIHGNITQTVQQHLEEVAVLTKLFSAKINLPIVGELSGLVHDFGKYGNAFQDHINPLTKPLDKKPDHSTAGAQFAWNHLKSINAVASLIKQMIAVCVAGHHGGLMDCISPDGQNLFIKRMDKSFDSTNFMDAFSKADPGIMKRLDSLLCSTEILDEMGQLIKKINESKSSNEIKCFYLGLFTRFLFSMLIDADRLSASGRLKQKKSDWTTLISRLEKRLLSFEADTEVNRIRAHVSQACYNFFNKNKGLYKLKVPTGGAKTLSSLRFALHHARFHCMKRIFYIVPYTSIIDQNAECLRYILEKPSDSEQVVLEHHSNLPADKDTEECRQLAENWDAPIVFTTLVQFLDAFYHGGTRAARRMHRLSDAVIIFDEVQAIPIKTVHLFNNAVNFLVEHCGATAVFCTATQPLLDRVDGSKGAVNFTGGQEQSEIIPKKMDLFKKLRRVVVEDRRKDEGWSISEIGEYAVSEAEFSGSALLVTNTKKAALAVYDYCSSWMNTYHLSTYMCPAHRKTIINSLKESLDKGQHAPFICVSTQLIEAGVDLDFGAVIRFLAGLDSIAQAAGRCNRNGVRDSGRVTIINPNHLVESLSKLYDIQSGKEKAETVLDEYKTNPERFNHDILHPDLMSLFYSYYFYKRSQEMDYPVKNNQILNRDDTLFSLLSSNHLSLKQHARTERKGTGLILNQSFKTAGKIFEVIDSGTTGIIVPYMRGKEIIADICSCTELEKIKTLLKEAQQYSVNIYRFEFEKLKNAGALHNIIMDLDIYALDPQYYNIDTGLVFEPSEPMSLIEA
ncbi:CRISPR-associated endonuclease Cas3'' [Desulfonatronovibrio magnus]|uniref:CRISPR-associated endonuclease Cas3'' n=1 Tax=Desulfonatronovibrio magnus TaxID=698827 RepID=UPI000699151D|nr:CRISPR-associated endonuclease Cas3'' [Desulfonatronovibrio magnus]